MVRADSLTAPAQPTAEPMTARYCRVCSYDLRGSLESRRCPECGRAFDPCNPRTTRPAPRKSGWRWVRRAAMLLLVVLLLLGGTWGWFWREWKREQRVLENLGNSAQVFGARTVGPEWLDPRLGRAGFVLVRVDQLVIMGDITDLTPLANFTGLTTLVLWHTPVSDLSPLANLPGLTSLLVNHTPVSDLSPLADLSGLTELVVAFTPITDLSSLADLTRLTNLELHHVSVSDLSPLANLSGLTHLQLRDTQVSDLSPLANLTELMHLDLRGTPVTDLSPLTNLTALERLLLPPETVTAAQAAELRRALPNCMITRW